MDFIMWTVVIILVALGAGISVFENIMKKRAENRVVHSVSWRVNLLFIFLLGIGAGIIYLGYSWWWLLLPAISISGVLAMSMAAMSGDESRIMRDEAAKRSQVPEYSLSINGVDIDVTWISLDRILSIGSEHLCSGKIKKIKGKRHIQGAINIKADLEMEWWTLYGDAVMLLMKEENQR